MLVRFIAAMLLLLVAEAGCRFGPPLPGINVVLIVLDAAGAAHFSAYGNSRKTTPRIDAIAKESTLFRRAYTQAAWTLPATVALMTGSYPTFFDLDGYIPSTAQTLATLLKSHGYVTAAFSESPFVTHDFGFDLGFDSFHEHFPFTRFKLSPRRYPGVDAAKHTQHVVEWIGIHAAEKLFLYVHLLPPHAPYIAPAPFRGMFQGNYRGVINGSVATLLAVDERRIKISSADLSHLKSMYHENLAYADEQVGRILSALKKNQILENTILIITSDHGEAFLEHGRLQHSSTVFEEMIHVPLIIRFPARMGRLPSEWDGIVELVDLLPSLCETFGFSPCVSDGRSFMQALRGGKDDKEFAFSRASTAEIAIITQRYKLIAGNRSGARIYDLEADPAERRNIAAHEPALVKRLATLAEERNNASPDPPKRQLRPEAVERLKALGYLHN